MNRLIALMASVVMAGTSFSGVTTHFALDTRSGMRLASAGSTLAVDYSPDFSSAQDVETVRVLTNGVVWVESAAGGTKDFTFGDTGLYQFTHQVLTNGVVAEEMMAWYAVAETGRVDIPDTWTEIPDGLFKNCDWLTSVTIPNSVTNIAATAFVGCSNIVDVVLPLGADTVVPGFYEAEIRDMNAFSEDNDIEQVARATVLSADMLTAETVPEHTMYGYAAYMWFEGDVTYEFLAYYDDKSSVKVDGSWVIQAASSECRSQTGAVKFDESGWHWIEVRGWNNGGEGAAYGSCSGVKWRRSGEDWRLFADTGDGALFRVDGVSFGLRSVLPDSYATVKRVVLVGDDGVVPKAFLKGCASLESVELPDTVESIDAQVFEGCIGLRAITIPSSLRFVGADAFLGCESLKRVDVESLEDWLKIRFDNGAANPLCSDAELYVGGERFVYRIEVIAKPSSVELSGDSVA